MDTRRELGPPLPGNTESPGIKLAKNYEKNNRTYSDCKIFVGTRYA